MPARAATRRLRAAVALLAAGCGFRLQGAAPLPAGVNSVHVGDQGPAFAVCRRARPRPRARRRERGRVRRRGRCGDPRAQDRTGRRVLSVSARNTPQEFEIFYVLEYSIDRGGAAGGAAAASSSSRATSASTRASCSRRTARRRSCARRWPATSRTSCCAASSRCRRPAARANRSVALTSSCVLPGSSAEWPASGTTREVGLRPGAVQVPGGHHRADHVVAALHDHGRDVADAAHAAQQLVLAARGSPC